MANYDLNAVSGINAASNGLAVISNNLANAETVGFKASRAEFADLFSGSQSSPGNGVRVDAITQDFTQGTLNDTGRELDMAVDGEGFFILEDKTGKYENVYTRNGSFKLDKDGYITDQSGNKVQGYLLNETLSTENEPVFETTLSSIDLDELNKKPQATDEMTYDINLDGQEVNNVDPAGTSSTNDDTDNSIGSSENLTTLMQPAQGTYQGSSDYATKKTIYDSLGGEHQLNISYYKRDVVDQVTSDIDANGNPVASPNGVKYTSWLVQYTITDDEGNYTGHLADTAGNVLDDGIPPAVGNPYEGQIYEMRYDTNGNLLGVYQPDNGAGAYDPTQISPTSGGVADADADVGATANNLSTAPNGTWAQVDGTPTLNFVIDNPLTGATDPLGGEIAGTPDNFQIELDFTEMTQYSGSYDLGGVSQNGYQVGDLVGLTTGSDGTIEARYSNGRSVPVAQLALANFTDKNALEKLGGQTYAETFASGTVQIGSPENNGYGSVTAGSLEYSNVDTTGELVHMIQTQRTYQASAQVISTSQTLTQTILNL
ncbi:MAG: flagellar hook protein FlgE [Hydrogenovibrio sp.]